MKQSKACNKCKQTLPLECFGNHSSTSDGLRSWCKPCDYQAAKKWRENNRDKVNETKRNWAAKNKDKKAADDNRYWHRNKEKITERTKKWREENKELLAKKQKDYREKNKDKKAALDRAWYLANKDRANENARRYRNRNPEKQNQIHKDYNRRNPEIYVTIAQNRRARKLQNGIFKVTKKDIKKILSQNCFYCNSSKEITLDHVVPISRGGTHGIGNLLPACRSCNSRKHTKFITEWKINDNQKN